MSQHKWLGMILLFHYCHQKKKNLKNLKEERLLELSKTVSDNFSTVPFFPESVKLGKLEKCMLCVGIPYLLVYNVHPNAHPIFLDSFQIIIYSSVLVGHLLKQTLWDRKNHQKIPQRKRLLTN